MAGNVANALIPALRRQMWVDLREFEAIQDSQSYTVSLCQKSSYLRLARWLTVKALAVEA